MSEAATSTEPIVGLRVWKLATIGQMPYLRSVYKETVWPYRKPLERDSLENAGIHAVKPGIRSGPSVADPCGVCGGLDVLSLFSEYDADVAGEVYLWGKVSEHDLGYLAEFAYPKKLFPHEDVDPVVVMQLEDEYGVPCEYRKEFAKIKPQTAPQQLYPHGLLGAGNRAATALRAQMQQVQAMQDAYRKAMVFGNGLLANMFRP